MQMNDVGLLDQGMNAKILSKFPWIEEEAEGFVFFEWQVGESF